MHFIALATDYDGTIATRGTVAEPTLTALTRLKRSGRKLLLVTGRQRPDLYSLFPAADLFDAIVAENGALIYWPETRREDLLAAPPPPEFAARLRERGIDELAQGRVVVATNASWSEVVRETVHEQRLKLSLIYNKGALMVLPEGVDKASGLRAALAALDISSQNVVAVGDAENDLELLRSAGLGVALANALPDLKEEADLVTAESSGAGVAELIQRWLGDEDGLATGRRRADLRPGR